MQQPKYPPNWKEVSHQLRSDGNWKCEHCGSQCLRPGELSSDRLDSSKIAQRRLQVHHIDRDPTNNDRSNLSCLCSPCHLKAHKPERQGRGVVKGQLSLDLTKAP